MSSDLQKIINCLIIELEKVNDLESWKQLKAKYTSKSSFLIELKQAIKHSSTDNKRKQIGNTLKEYNSKVNKILFEKKDSLEASFFIKEEENIYLSNDNSKMLDETKIKRIHPLTRIAKRIYDFMSSNNFSFKEGYEIETETYNFEKLNVSKNHPARTMQDTFYLENNNYVLRTHSTNITARYLELNASKHNLGVYTIGRVYRNDEVDKTHNFQFTQFDLFKIGDDSSIENLKWLLENVLSYIFEEKVVIRFRQSYFPFTEPSYEIDMRFNENKKWIEILGCGMINLNVLKNVGINNNFGFAAGVGVERLAMLKYLIDDVRMFYTNDIDFLGGDF